MRARTAAPSFPPRRLLLPALLGLAVQQALAAVTPVEQRWQAWEQHRRLEQDSQFHGLQWRAIGPAVQGGRIVDIEVVPGKPYSFYVAYASGGVWRTDDNGVSFRPLSDAEPTLITGDLAVDPKRPEVLWLGSGEPNASRSSYSGLGLFRSDDGGKSFRPAGLAGADRVARIVVNPADSKHVCVAATGRLYTPGGERGVWCSYDDGASWQHTLKGDGKWTGAIDLAVAPDDPQTWYASTWERSRRPWNFVESGQGSGVWRSRDGGRSWTRLEGFPGGPHIGRIGLALAPSKPGTLYASIDHQQPLDAEQSDPGDRALAPARLKGMSKEEFLRQDPEELEQLLRSHDFERELTVEVLLQAVREDRLTIDELRARLRDGNAALFDTEVRGLQLWRSDDGGDSWRQTHDDVLRDFVYSFGYYFGQVRVAPDDADRVYLLGVPLAVSDDGGQTFRGINDPSVHVDHHAWWIDPQFPQRVMSGNDGGLDVSYDGGQSWLKLDRQPVAQSYAVQFDFAEPYNVYTGLQDNGTWKGSSRARPDDLDAWSFVNGGDGMQIQVDPRDNVLYTGYQFGFYRSSAGHPVRPLPKAGEPALRFNWQTPILLSPHTPEVLYMGANRLFRSTDRGQSFSPISPDLSSSRERGDVPFATLTTISESPLAFGLLWAGTDDGRLHVSSDGGGNWQAVDGKLPDLWVSRVAASAHVRERAYASFNGYREDDFSAHVYVTEDLGRRWRDIGRGLPAEPVNVIVEDTVNADVLYVGTDRGVYVSLDRGDSWQALDASLPNVPVHDLKLHPRDRELIAGTHGRGVWVLDVLPVQQLDAKLQRSALHLFGTADVQFQRSWRSAPSRWFPDAPADRPRVPLRWWAARDGSARLEVRDGAGAVLRSIELQSRAGINSAEWDLLLDPAAALAAEQARIDKARADKSLVDPINLKETPIAEGQRLGHPPYAPPGTYTLVLAANGAKSETTLVVTPPKPYDPRFKPKWKLREK